ncbi:ATP synthase subunit I [Robertmurraya beringensis]|uniref:ATP synthase subunit I n=1 Tax=Robertmurraya beringensis TaxID=641660 RepID=A0ABV6KR77_9BACI
MPETKGIYIRQRKWLFFLMAFYALGWGFTSYQTVFLGLAFGTSLSLFNMWLLNRRIDRFGETIQKGETVRSLGMFSRMATAVVAVMIAMEYPDLLHFYSVILGLMTSYIVIMIDILFQSFKFLRK